MDNQKNVLTVPSAIVLAGIIIGAAIFLSRASPAKDTSTQPSEQTAASITNDIAMRPVSQSDHILGNPNAKIVMVEYSDLECPFCKSFHKTMQSLLEQYGKSGDIAWVYRHFPLDIHPRSPKESEAAECAFEQGGGEKFWAFVNKIFEITPSNNRLDPAKLSDTATQIGLNAGSFQTCLDSGKYADKVKKDVDDGLRAGVNGTPHTVLVLLSPVTAAAEKRLSQINQDILRQLPPGSPNVITMDSTRRKVGISGAFQLPLMKEILDLLLSGK